VRADGCSLCEESPHLDTRRPTWRAGVSSTEHERAGRLILADDDVLLREGIASLLGNAGYDVVGQAGDAASLIDIVREQRPELVVIDIRMPPSHTTEGLQAARTIGSDFPEMGILLLSAHVEVETALDLSRRGSGSAT
jgi:DNA-binding NarL/FixJ family response regulator